MGSLVVSDGYSLAKGEAMRPSCCFFRPWGLLCEIGLAIGFFGISIDLACSGDNEVDPANIFRTSISGKNSVQGFRFDLSKAKPGEKIHAVVMITNLTAESLTIRSAEANCKWIIAKVPQEVFEAKSTAVLEFEFRVPLVVTKLQEHYSVTINCKGARQTLALNFYCDLVDVISFRTSENMFQFSEKKGTQRVVIPILLSDPSLIKGVTVSADPVFGFHDGKIENQKGQSHAVFSFDRSDARSDATAGEI